MHLSVYLPLLLTAVFGQLAPTLSRRLPPAAGTWLLSIGGLLAAAGSGAALALLGFTLVGQAPLLATRGHWSDQTLRHHDPIPIPVAAAALAVLVVLAGRVIVVGVRRVSALREAHRLAAVLHAPAGDLAVLDDSEPQAFAVPGHPGRVVVSTGLLRRLDASQRRALLAHERAHLTGRHHLHHTAARLAAANPLLHRLPSAVTLACERWADETAAATCRRDTVADALTRAATNTGIPASAVVLAAAVTDMADRIGALRAPAPRLRLWRVALLIGLLAATAATLAEAMHDTERLFDLAQATYRGGQR
jgi:Zn-dependent protease with chaperone function